jgi:hypothetical protein
MLLVDYFLNHPEFGLLCLQTTVGQFSPDHTYDLRNSTPFVTYDKNIIHVTKEVAGNALIINNEVIKKLGIFYEYGKYGYMDPDYSCRVNMLGYKSAFVPISDANMIFCPEEVEMSARRKDIPLEYSGAFFARQQGYREYKIPLFAGNTNDRHLAEENIIK